MFFLPNAMYLRISMVDGKYVLISAIFFVIFTLVFVQDSDVNFCMYKSRTYLHYNIQRRYVSPNILLNYIFAGTCGLSWFLKAPQMYAFVCTVPFKIHWYNRQNFYLFMSLCFFLLHISIFFIQYSGKYFFYFFFLFFF